MKLELRSRFQARALFEALDDLLIAEEAGVQGHDIEGTLEGYFEDHPEVDRQAHLARMREALRSVCGRVPHERFPKRLELELSDAEAELVRMALEHHGQLTGDYTGYYGPNVESFKPHHTVRWYDIIESACWKLAKKITPKEGC